MWANEVWKNGFLLYKYPCEKGQYYFVNLVGRMRVISTDYLVTVPAGTFHCIYYETVSNDFSDEKYFVSVDIGLVKKINYSYIWELFDYTLH
jgi:hypothetical protein